MFRLKEVLEEKKMTSKELALRAHVTEAVISRYINGVSSPRLDFMERVAQILEVDVVDLIKAPDGSAPSRIRPLTKEQKQHEAYMKMVSYCKYYQGAVALPIKWRNDATIYRISSIESHICYDEFIYEYDTGGNSLRNEFYRRVASEFSRDTKTYVEYMNLYFGDKPKILSKMFDLFGHPEELAKKR